MSVLMTESMRMKPRRSSPVEMPQPGDVYWQASETIERSIEVIERIDASFEARFEVLP